MEVLIGLACTYLKKKKKKSFPYRRRPAWTDRILHQVHVDAYENVKLGVEQTSYEATRDYTQSDHRPVRANYKIKVCVLKCSCMVYCALMTT